MKINTAASSCKVSISSSFAFYWNCSAHKCLFWNKNKKLVYFFPIKGVQLVFTKSWSILKITSHLLRPNGKNNTAKIKLIVRPLVVRRLSILFHSKRVRTEYIFYRFDVICVWIHYYNVKRIYFHTLCEPSTKLHKFYCYCVEPSGKKNLIE